MPGLLLPGLRLQDHFKFICAFVLFERGVHQSLSCSDLECDTLETHLEVWSCDHTLPNKLVVGHRSSPRSKVSHIVHHCADCCFLNTQVSLQFLAAVLHEAF